MEKEIWFKRKRYGLGWYPSTWQGWAVILMFVFSITAIGTYMNNHEHSVSDFLMSSFPLIYIQTVFLIIICSAKGEKLKWQWGKDNGSSENKDGN